MIDQCSDGHSYLAGGNVCPWCEVKRLRAELHQANEWLRVRTDSKRLAEDQVERLRAEVAALKKERDAIYRAAMTAGVSAMVIQDEVGAALKEQK